MKDFKLIKLAENWSLWNEYCCFWKVS